MLRCPCKYCRGSKFNALRRRNPDDLERLEKIAKAREIYLETQSLRETSRRIGHDTTTVRPWIEDLIPPEKRIKAIRYTEEDRQRARALYLDIRNIQEVAQRMGINQLTIRKWTVALRKNYPPIKRKYTEEEKQHVIAVFQRTRSMDLTAEETGVVRSRVQKWTKPLRDKIRADKRAKRKPIGNRRDWTFEEDEIMITEYADMPRDQLLSQLPDRTWNSILGRAQKLNLNRSIWADRQRRQGLREDAQADRKQRAQEMRQQGVGLKAIAKELKADWKTVRKWVASRRNPDDLETLEKIERARQLYKKGVSISQIQREVRAARKTVNSWISDLRTKKRRVYTEEDKARAIMLFQQGCKIKDIAEELGADRGTVSKWRKSGLFGEQEVPKPVRKYSEEDVDNSALLYQLGFELDDIAKSLDLNIHALYAWRKKGLLGESYWDPNTLRPRVRELCRTTNISLVDIARKLNIPKSNVYLWCRGIERPGYEKRKGKKAQRKMLKEQAIALRETEGLTASQIAEKLGLSPVTVGNWIKGIKKPGFDPEAEAEWVERIRQIYRDATCNQSETKRRAKELGRPIVWKTLKKWVEDPRYGTPIICDDPFAEQKLLAKQLYQSLDPEILYGGKPSLQLLADKIGSSKGTLTNWLKRGILGPKVSLLDKAKELYLSGDPSFMWQGEPSVTKIAKHLGCSRNTLFRWKREGLLDLPRTFNALRRRNPDDLETLEKISFLREKFKDEVLYGGKTFSKLCAEFDLLGSGYYLAKSWVADIWPSAEKVHQSIILLKSYNLKPQDFTSILRKKLRGTASDSMMRAWYRERSVPASFSVRQAIIDAAKDASPQEVIDWKKYIQLLFDKGYTKAEIVEMLFPSFDKHKTTIRGWVNAVGGKSKWEPPIDAHSLIKAVADSAPNKEGFDWGDAYAELLKKGYYKQDIARRIAAKTGYHWNTVVKWLRDESITDLAARQAVLDINDEVPSLRLDWREAVKKLEVKGYARKQLARLLEKYGIRPNTATQWFYQDHTPTLANQELLIRLADELPALDWQAALKKLLDLYPAAEVARMLHKKDPSITTGGHRLRRLKRPTLALKQALIELSQKNRRLRRRNPETIEGLRKALETEEDFIIRERYQRRLLELRGITPLNSVTALESAIENCQSELEDHGYSLDRWLGQGSHGQVYQSDTGEVTKITRSPMEAVIAQSLIGESLSCFPEIYKVEDITLLCDSEIPMFAIKREHLHNFKLKEKRWPSALTGAISQMFLLISRNDYEKVDKLKEHYPLDEEEIEKLEEFAACVIATKQKYNLILNDLDTENLGMRDDGSIVIRDFSHCARIY